MDYEERLRILSKDYITREEFIKLTGIDKSKASGVMTIIRKLSQRPIKAKRGTIFLEDYILYMGFTPDRYFYNPTPKPLPELMKADDPPPQEPIKIEKPNATLLRSHEYTTLPPKPKTTSRRQRRKE